MFGHIRKMQGRIGKVVPFNVGIVETGFPNFLIF